MCGIVGAFGLADPEFLDHICVEAGRRGPHSWGTASGPSGEIERGYGPLVSSGYIPKSRLDWWLGISRLSTSSDWQILEHGQPIHHSGKWLVHNGNILSADLSKYPYECDSFMIADECKVNASDVGRFMRKIPDPCAFIMTDGKRMIATSRGLPLWVYKTPHCTYLCSRPLSSSWSQVSEVWLTVATGSWAGYFSA